MNYRVSLDEFGSAIHLAKNNQINKKILKGNIKSINRKNAHLFKSCALCTNWHKVNQKRSNATAIANNPGSMSISVFNKMNTGILNNIPEKKRMAKTHLPILPLDDRYFSRKYFIKWKKKRCYFLNLFATSWNETSTISSPRKMRTPPRILSLRSQTMAAASGRTEKCWSKAWSTSGSMDPVWISPKYWTRGICTPERSRWNISLPRFPIRLTYDR